MENHGIRQNRWKKKKIFLHLIVGKVMIKMKAKLQFNGVDAIIQPNGNISEINITRCGTISYLGQNVVILEKILYKH
jgi:hypothetical protein